MFSFGHCIDRSERSVVVGHANYCIHYTGHAVKTRNRYHPFRDSYKMYVNGRCSINARIDDCISRASQCLNSDTPIQAFYVRLSIHPSNVKKPSDMDERSLCLYKVGCKAICYSDSIIIQRAQSTCPPTAPSHGHFHSTRQQRLKRME